MSQRIAACMILGDNFKDEELVSLFDSLVTARIDKLFIAYNGTKGRTGSMHIPLDVRVRRFDWEDDFGKARQQSFSLVPQDEFDWILWIDSDDFLVLDEGIEIHDYLEGISDEVSGLFLKYDYAVEPDTGQVVVEQWRERILRTGIEWRWVHPIHEVCLGPPGTRFLRKEGVKVVHQRTSGDERGARERNRRIISKAVVDYPEESRFRFYYAGETMAAADQEEDPETRSALIEEAIASFVKFKEMSDTVGDDYFIAQCRIAELLRMDGKFVEAMEADLETIAIYPSWPDGYIGLAKSCMELADFSRMRDFAKIATLLPKPHTSASIESMNYTFTPLFLLGIAYEGLGEYELAIDYYQLAAEHWTPPGDKIGKKIEEIREQMELSVEIEKKEDELLQRRNTRKEKSIAFVTNPIPEAWHPELLKVNGSGGAELCIMNLAPMFAADGWRVAVYGTPAEYRGMYGDVEYWDANDLTTRDEFTVVIGSRTSRPFEAGIPAKAKIVWMHDVNVGPHFEIFDADAVACLTPWHKAHFQALYGIPDDKMFIVPNGIDLSRFPVRDRGPMKPKFIWSSSYDRGLETVLSLWPYIKKEYPESTLDIFYGWNMYVKTIEQYRKVNSQQADHLMQFMEKILKQMKVLGADGDSGITDHGRVNQEELAEYMLDSHLWAYPTQFMETYCITAVEMQAAGVIPIASNLAALTNNVVIKELLVTGWPQNSSYQRQFLNTIDIVMTAPLEQVEAARTTARSFAETQTWENSYSVWNNLLHSVGVN